ncbi:MAG: hypothetical protein ABR529_13030 [Actinomycetota bacterium]
MARLSRDSLTAFATLLLLGAACGGSNGGGEAGEGGGGSAVDVTLQEFAVGAPSSASAGEVTFNVSNIGEETHEFVVIKTDLGATELPTAKDGSVDEAGSGMEVVDEVEDLAAGKAETLTVDLDAGHYVLICNVVEKEEGKTVSHYQNGMRAELTAE